MPVKKKKGSGKKKKRKDKKKGLLGLKSIAEVLRDVRQQYEIKCKDFKSYAHQDVKRLLNQYALSNTLLVKVSPFDNIILLLKILFENLGKSVFCHIRISLIFINQ